MRCSDVSSITTTTTTTTTTDDHNNNNKMKSNDIYNYDKYIYGYVPIQLPLQVQNLLCKCVVGVRKLVECDHMILDDIPFLLDVITTNGGSGNSGSGSGSDNGNNNSNSSSNDTTTTTTLLIDGDQRLNFVLANFELDEDDVTTDQEVLQINLNRFSSSLLPQPQVQLHYSKAQSSPLPPPTTTTTPYLDLLDQILKQLSLEVVEVMYQNPITVATRPHR